jgi:HAD superfamily hydrolase (TIGR01549 family)
MFVAAVFFDVGETLVDETRYWGLWADYLGVPRFTFFAALGAVIERGLHHREVFNIFDSQFNLEQAWEIRRQQGYVYNVLPADFYPDVHNCLKNLKVGGYRIGIAGNQPEECQSVLRDAGIEADWVASSSKWGIEKPSPLFFERLVEETGLPPSSIVYVGDRHDNDMEPAGHAGLIPILIKRGPWAHIQNARDSLSVQAEIRTLEELPAVIEWLRT